MADDKLVLAEPTKEMKDEILQYKEEHFKYGDMQVHGSGGLAYYGDFEAWLEHIEEIKDSDVRTSTFFSKRLPDGKMIGCVKIHQALNDKNRSGGHIAYGIRPSERGKGYGTKQLKLALEIAQGAGMKQVVVACDKANIASAKTAMSCGGVLLEEFEEDGVEKQHYLIKL